MDYEKLYSFVISKLELEIDVNICYHDVHHTQNVIENASYIAHKENISEHEITLLKTAALLHDVGFFESHLNHEELGCAFAKKNLVNFNYTNQEIDQICEMIMATKIPQTPKNNLSEILCDADLFYLGDEQYEFYAAKLFLELQKNRTLSNNEDWIKRQIEFLNSHTFFTRTAKEDLEAKKQKNKIHLESIWFR